MQAGNEYLNANLLEIPVALGEEILQGNMVGINAYGYAVLATTGSAKIVGMAVSDVNTVMEVEDGMEVVKVKRGAFFLKNSDLRQADLFKRCYVKDAQTVTKDSASGVAAGTAVMFEGDYVVVEIGGYNNDN